jgi:oligopeptide/dipeptide ABC transporter ATP-binding protein
MHPYTLALASAVPDPTQKRERFNLQGEVPSPLHPPGGCRYHPRCPVALDICSLEEPAFRQVSPGRWAACWRV